MPTITPGAELMQRLNDGTLQQAPSAFLSKTREDVSVAIEELLEVGARIRPLLVTGARVGWVRGVHPSERKALKRWITDEVELIEHLILLGTTFTIEEIRNLSMIEMRSVSRVIREMTESDLRLYPFISAFVTTNTSEQMWYSHGALLASFRDKAVTLPDGKILRVTTPCDQARLWSTLCNYRVQAKNRLEASQNAVLIIRPWVGKGANTLVADLKTIGRSLQTDTLEPWKEAVQAKADRNLEDGWAHSEDDSVEGLQRELRGMLNNDRHERLIARFDAQERAAAEKRQRDIDERISKRGGRGFFEQAAPSAPMTQEDVDNRSRTLKLGRPKLGPVASSDSQSSAAERLAKYR